MAMKGLNAGTFTTAAGDKNIWITEVMAREAEHVATRENWKSIWTEHEASGAHKDFDVKHVSYASVLPTGNVEVHIPSRGLTRAGGPSHYMQYLYLKDEKGDDFLSNYYSDSSN